MLSTTQHRDQLGRALMRAARLASLTPQGPPVWGRYDRTVGVPVRPAGHAADPAADQEADRAWLRVAPFRARDVGGKGWTGMKDAEALIPPSVPRPHLLDHYSWSPEGDDGPVYLAALMTYVTSPACASTDMLRDDPGLDLDRVLDLPDDWWTSLRASLSTLATVRTNRTVISQAYLDRALPAYLQAPGLDTTPPQGWQAAHGDLHWANLTVTGPTLLDWEGWGLAPAGYDAARLVVSSLGAPAVHKRAREAFAPVLDSEAGRFAELVVCAELIQRAEREHDRSTLATVRAHADGLLQRT